MAAQRGPGYPNEPALAASVADRSRLFRSPRFDESPYFSDACEPAAINGATTARAGRFVSAMVQDEFCQQTSALRSKVWGNEVARQNRKWVAP